MDVSTIVAVLTALGVRELVAGVARHVAGKPERERAAIHEERERRKEAEQEAAAAKRARDAEAARRRLIQEHASDLRSELIETCNRDPQSLPPWPTLD